MNRSSRIFKITVLLSLTGLIFIAGFYAGIRSNRTGFTSLLSSKLTAATNQDPLILSKTDELVATSTPAVHIELSKEAYQQLSDERNMALQEGLIKRKNISYHKGQMVYQGDTVQIKLRLKGDHVDHVNTEKWSFRVKCVDGMINSMKKFSLQAPKTRNYVYEWLVHKTLEKEGLFHLRYDFVEVYVNGERRGVMAMEEHFDDKTIANNGLNKGLILKYNENLAWAHNPSSNEIYGEEAFLSAEPQTFGEGKVLDNPKKKAWLTDGASKLWNFKAQSLPIDSVFDVDEAARFVAVCDILCAHHGFSWNNLRFYYNGTNGQMRHVGYDFDAGNPDLANQLVYFCPPDLSPGLFRSQVDPYFKNEAFYTAYIKHLKRMSNQSYLEALVSSNEQGLKERLGYIWQDEPAYIMDMTMLREKGSFIRSLFKPEQPVQAFASRAENGRLTINCANLLELDVEIIGLESKDTSIALAHRLGPKQAHQSPWFHALGTDVPYKDITYKIKVLICGDSTVHKHELQPWEIHQRPTPLTPTIDTLKSIRPL